MSTDSKSSLRNTPKLKTTTQELNPSLLVTTSSLHGLQKKWKDFLPKKLSKINNTDQPKNQSGFIRTALIKELIGERKELSLLLKIKDNAVIHGWLQLSMRCQWLTVLDLEQTFNFLFNKWLIATPPDIHVAPLEVKIHTDTSKSSVLPQRQNTHTLGLKNLASSIHLCQPSKLKR